MKVVKDECTSFSTTTNINSQSEDRNGGSYFDATLGTFIQLAPLIQLNGKPNDDDQEKNEEFVKNFSFGVPFSPVLDEDSFKLESSLMTSVSSSLYHGSIKYSSNAYDTLDTKRWRDFYSGSKKLVMYDPIESNQCNNYQLDWENPIIATSDPQLAISHQKKKKKYVACEELKFTRFDLSNARVLGQVGNKFIATLMMASCDEETYLVLVDQHAAHERIRLEEYCARVDFHGKLKSSKPLEKRTTLTPPLILHLPMKVVNIMLQHRKEMMQVGIKFSSPVTGGDDSTRKVFVQQVPSIFVGNKEPVKQTNSSNVNSCLIKEFILEQTDHLQLHGNTSACSTTLFKILASYACHGAIRFGDPLSLEVCRELIVKLSQCQLPFQCAHGRPSIAPLCNVRTPYQKSIPCSHRLNFERLKLPRLSSVDIKS